jgi:hypothetical protein
VTLITRGCVPVAPFQPCMLTAFIIGRGALQRAEISSSETAREFPTLDLVSNLSRKDAPSFARRQKNTMKRTCYPDIIAVSLIHPMVGLAPDCCVPNCGGLGVDVWCPIYKYLTRTLRVCIRPTTPLPDHRNLNRLCHAMLVQNALV